MRELSKEGMARALGLLSETDLGRSRIKSFAVLMFADGPADFIPGAFLQLISDVADDTDRMTERVFDGPIWMQVQMATHWFKDEVQRSYTLRSRASELHRIVYNYPEAAFEELATNVVLHRLSAYADNLCYRKSKVMRSRHRGPQAAGFFHAQRLRIT